MMKYLLYMIFMIPCLILKKSWIYYQLMVCLIFMLLMMSFSNYFYFSISYFFGMDNVSYGLILLSFFIGFLMINSSINIKRNFSNNLFLLVNICLIFFLFLIFCSLNIFIMYLFFEFSLVPLMILILGWGYQPERMISGIYLFLYTLFASLPLLLIIMNFYSSFNSLFFDKILYYNNYFFSFFFTIFAFLVKLPLFMLHFWLPSAHVQAPISGSMILAGLLLKVGGYGMMRFSFLNEFGFMFYGYILFSLSLVGTLMVSFICLIQGDLKCMIAYSSIAHMGLSLMSLITLTKFGIVGFYIMMIGHGLCSSGLFCLSNIMYERIMSRSFFLNKGLISFMPNLCLMMFMMCSFNMSCPPSINFLSEVLIMISSINFYFLSSFYLVLISFMSACFSFYLFSFSYHGQYFMMYSYMINTIQEFILLITHIIPIIFLVLMIDLMF
nr:NADH dehydrogenase subunit 4 [Subulatus sp.]